MGLNQPWNQPTMKKQYIFFLKLDYFWGTFWKKRFFSPRNVKHLKITKYWDPPPLFFTQNVVYQNDLEWPKLDFKHNFEIPQTVINFTDFCLGFTKGKFLKKGGVKSGVRHTKKRKKSCKNVFQAI